MAPAPTMTRRPFSDRRAAGRALAEALREYAGRDDIVVLGLPRGGVLVAAEVASALGVALDVLTVRKLGLPAQPELAMGAVAGSGDAVVTFRNEMVLARAGVPEDVFDDVRRRELAVLTRREQAYRSGAAAAAVEQRIVIVVDDGLATGSTMRAALTSARDRGAARLVAAVPVGSRTTCDELSDVADEVVCVLSPTGVLAVGQAYDNFEPTTDDEVCAALARAREARGGNGAR